ncbi:uncharacterized protein CIMG_12768 [Coccidioides immitis RS]|uniref:Uncharacterized protein n=1 Tax=Coccidioides immitis (strain RS) TaxID=246410 RepID=A0A0D8JV44_COCIM|nr:uncharacterized protein CIMG_12768 [Coccidioides immitis RS]KJF60133.1 hypothetical protein CIMG_12768 [Coccidioides immitis RS]
MATILECTTPVHPSLGSGTALDIWLQQREGQEGRGEQRVQHMPLRLPSPNPNQHKNETGKQPLPTSYQTRDLITGMPSKQFEGSKGICKYSIRDKMQGLKTLSQQRLCYCVKESQSTPYSNLKGQTSSKGRT